MSMPPSSRPPRSAMPSTDPRSATSPAAPTARPPGDPGPAVLLACPHQLAHRAHERLREPALPPARPLPLAVHRASRPLDRARAALRVVGPADRALRDALGPLDTPLDPVIGPREAVVDRDGAQAAVA